MPDRRLSLLDRQFQFNLLKDILVVSFIYVILVVFVILVDLANLSQLSKSLQFYESLQSFQSNQSFQSSQSVKSLLSYQHVNFPDRNAFFDAYGQRLNEILRP